MEKPLLCVDPGTKKSGFVVLYIDKSIGESGVVDNEDMMDMVSRDGLGGYDKLCIEMIESQGMPVGKETFNTVLWIGRFIQEFGFGFSELITRREVKLYLCGTMRAKDANVRQAIIDMYEPSGGGKTPQIGIKAQPGPLFGVSTHAWSALAVGLTYLGGK